jgi:hypothetical protein
MPKRRTQEEMLRELMRRNASLGGKDQPTHRRRATSLGQEGRQGEWCGQAPEEGLTVGRRAGEGAVEQESRSKGA